MVFFSFLHLFCVFVCLLLVSMFLLRKPLQEELERFVDEYMHQVKDLQDISMYGLRYEYMDKPSEEIVCVCVRMRACAYLSE